MRLLFEELVKLSVQPFIISASPHEFVAQAHHVLPVKAEHIFGLYKKDNGVIDRLPQFAHGKTERLKNIVKGQLRLPVMALMASSVRRNCERTDSSESLVNCGCDHE